MPFDWASFFGGIMIGAGGQYVADLAADRRRKRETKTQATKRFEKLRLQMPALLSEIKADLAGDPLVREFVVLPNNRVAFNSRQARFFYYENEHDHLGNKVTLLLEADYIRDVTTTNTPIYRMSEEFVELLEKA